ncbi:hypothetical protein MVEN_01086900 [Mycena venus]|uniref:N-terminal Ras-GEF domain-containing protein n=1 Tax=Mycena venus TaxID=2733690 RepID=A0A8H6Y8A0_9AGAR|nr:hypothetical protein MVEN_01086900 [Mycena venus]
MSVDTAVTLTIEIAHLIQNVPRNRKQLDELNGRCISLLASLSDSSLDMEDRNVAVFIDEMEMVLRGIQEKLKHWSSLSFAASFRKQGEIQAWIASQNKRIEDAFRTMNTQVLVMLAGQHMENRQKQERDLDEIRRYLTDILTELKSQFNTASLDLQPVREAMNIISVPSLLETSARPKPEVRVDYSQRIQLPSIAAAGLHICFDALLPLEETISASDGSVSQIGPNSAPFEEPICEVENGKVLGNVAGLVKHLIETDDQQFKQVMLDTYTDYLSQEKLFEILKWRFEEVQGEMGYYSKRYKIIKVMVMWLQTASLEILNDVRAFVDGDRNGLIPYYQKMIRKAIGDRRVQSRELAAPSLKGPSSEPMHPNHLAVALTFHEADVFKTIRPSDYLSYVKGSPCRIDIALSEHGKMMFWVKSSILRHDEAKERGTRDQTIHAGRRGMSPAAQL